MFLTILLIFLMAGTGTALKYPTYAVKIPFVDIDRFRMLHNNMSPFFSISLFVMMLTGVYMYVFPLLRSKQSTPKTPIN